MSGDDTMMKACHYHKHGRSTYVVGDVPRPSENDLEDGQVLVKVQCASLNPADWKSAEGGQAMLLSFAWPRIFGFDFSGTVVASRSTYANGDKVFGMIRGLPQFHRGTLAEYVIVDGDVCAPCPSNVSHADCAAVPLVAITAVKMLDACKLQRFPKAKSGPRVFITGGAGGMGTILIQLAKAMYGCSEIVTTASPGKKTSLCQSLGATKVVNYREERFEKVLSSDNDSDLFDAILDCTGEAKRCVSLLKQGGHMCSILAGPGVEAIRTWMKEARIDSSKATFGVSSFLHSSIGGSLVNCFSGNASLARKCAKRGGGGFHHVIGTGNGEIMKIIAYLMKNGSVKAVIDKNYSLDDAIEAISYQKSGRAAGKVVVTVGDDAALSS